VSVAATAIVSSRFFRTLFSLPQWSPSYSALRHLLFPSARKVHPLLEKYLCPRPEMGIGIRCMSCPLVAKGQAVIQPGEVLLSEEAVVSVPGSCVPSKSVFVAAMEQILAWLPKSSSSASSSSSAAHLEQEAQRKARLWQYLSLTSGALTGEGQDARTEKEGCSSLDHHSEQHPTSAAEDAEEAVAALLCSIWHHNSMKVYNPDFALAAGWENNRTQAGDDDASEGASSRDDRSGAEGDGAALFLDASRFNHSCRPNALCCFETTTTTRRSGQANTGTAVVLRVVALRPIFPGEEVTITYTDILSSRDAKARHLKFVCHCEFCASDSQEQLEYIQCPNCSWWVYRPTRTV